MCHEEPDVAHGEGKGARFVASALMIIYLFPGAKEEEESQGNPIGGKE